MDMFSPEFSAYWLSEPVEARHRDAGEPETRDADAASQQQALEDLAGRVNAARSII